MRSDANTSWRWIAGQKPLYRASVPSSAAILRIIPSMPTRDADDADDATPAPEGADAPLCAEAVASRAFWRSWRRTLAVSIGSVATCRIATGEWVARTGGGEREGSADSERAKCLRAGGKIARTHLSGAGAQTRADKRRPPRKLIRHLETGGGAVFCTGCAGKVEQVARA